MIGTHTARVAAQVTEAKAGPLAGRQQPRNPVCLLEAAVETDDAVAGDIAAALPVPAAVTGCPIDLGPERQDTVLDEAASHWLLATTCRRA